MIEWSEKGWNKGIDERWSLKGKRRTEQSEVKAEKEKLYTINLNKKSCDKHASCMYGCKKLCTLIIFMMIFVIQM